MKRGSGVSHGSQEWGGKGLGRPKMKHEKGFGCFMAPKSGVGRGEGFGKVQNGSQECCGNGLGKPKMTHEKKGLRASWFRRVGWEGLGNAKNEA